MSCKVQYSDQAEDARRRMTAPVLARFDAGMAKLAADPYGCGSTPAKGVAEPDRRAATVGGHFVVYYVSRSVMTITAVHIIG